MSRLSVGSTSSGGGRAGARNNGDGDVIGADSAANAEGGEHGINEVLLHGLVGLVEGSLEGRIFGASGVAGAVIKTRLAGEVMLGDAVHGRGNSNNNENSLAARVGVARAGGEGGRARLARELRLSVGAVASLLAGAA